MRLNKRFATGCFTLILTAILLADIVLGDISKEPRYLLRGDRSKLIGAIQKVRFDIASFYPATKKLSKPIEIYTYEFIQDGELKNPPNPCGFNGGEITELKENGDITIESFFKSGTLISETLHVFDADGNIVESTPLYNDIGDYRKTVYIHEFDSRGNWIKRIWVKKDANSPKQSSITPALVEIRTITYY